MSFSVHHFHQREHKIISLQLINTIVSLFVTDDLIVDSKSISVAVHTDQQHQYDITPRYVHQFSLWALSFAIDTIGGVGYHVKFYDTDSFVSPSVIFVAKFNNRPHSFVYFLKRRPTELKFGIFDTVVFLRHS